MRSASGWARRPTAADAVDDWIRSLSDFPETLQAELDLHWIHGGKSAVELALYIKPLEAMLFGDEVRSHASGSLNLLPDGKLSDKAQVIASIRALQSIPFKHALLGDGDHIFHCAHEQFDALLNSLS